MFEVHDLKYATLATVSRCGMVWFSEDVLKSEMICENFLARLENIPLEDEGEIFTTRDKTDANEVSPTVKVQRDVSSTLTQYFSSDGLVKRCLEYASTLEHIMDFTRLRALGSLFSMLNEAVRNILQ